MIPLEEILKYVYFKQIRLLSTSGMFGVSELKLSSEVHSLSGL